MNDATSLTLLNGIRTTGDGAAWQRFVDIYQPLLEGWLRRKGIPRDVAEDVRQEVLVKVHQEIGDFQHNGRPGAFRNWLRAVMAHRLRTVLRRQWREPRNPQQASWSDLADQLADDNSGLTQAWNAEHDAYLLERLMQVVAPEFQEKTLLAFRRVVLERQEAAEVADKLDLSVNAVRIAQSRVLAALRRVGEGILD